MQNGVDKSYLLGERGKEYPEHVLRQQQVALHHIFQRWRNKLLQFLVILHYLQQGLYQLHKVCITLPCRLRVDMEVAANLLVNVEFVDGVGVRFDASQYGRGGALVFSKEILFVVARVVGYGFHGHVIVTNPLQQWLVTVRQVVKCPVKIIAPVLDDKIERRTDKGRIDEIRYTYFLYNADMVFPLTLGDELPLIELIPLVVINAYFLPDLFVAFHQEAVEVVLNGFSQLRTQLPFKCALASGRQVLAVAHGYQPETRFPVWPYYLKSVKSFLDILATSGYI